MYCSIIRLQLFLNGEIYCSGLLLHNKLNWNSCLFQTQPLFAKNLSCMSWSLSITWNWWVMKYGKEQLIFGLKNVFVNSKILTYAWTHSSARCLNHHFFYKIDRTIVFLPSPEIICYMMNNKSSFHVHKSSSKLPTPAVVRLPDHQQSCENYHTWEFSIINLSWDSWMKAIDSASLLLHLGRFQASPSQKPSTFC